MHKHISGTEKVESAIVDWSPITHVEVDPAQLFLGDAFKPVPGPTQPQLRGMKVMVDGQLMTVCAETLDNLRRDPSKTAEPEMVAPLMAARNRLTILSAREKMGKSTLAAWVAARISTGGMLWGHQVPPRKVLWCGLEEHSSDAVRRFIAMKAEGHSVAIVDNLGAEPVRQLRAEVAAFRPDFCVVDSLSRLFGGGLDDENSASQVNRFLSPLLELVRESGTAFLLLHHGAKKSDGYRGSTAIGAQVDMILNMTSPSDSSTSRVVTAKGRFKLQDYCVHYDLDALTYDLLADASPETMQEAETARIRRRILAYLEANPGTGSKKLRAAIGGRAQEVDAAAEDLVLQGLTERLGVRGGFRLIKAP